MVTMHTTCKAALATRFVDVKDRHPDDLIPLVVCCTVLDISGTTLEAMMLEQRDLNCEIWMNVVTSNAPNCTGYSIGFWTCLAAQIPEL